MLAYDHNPHIPGSLCKAKLPNVLIFTPKVACDLACWDASKKTEVRVVKLLQPRY